MSENELKLRLTLDVHYTLDGTSRKELERCLQSAAPFLAANGLLSGDTGASVEVWTSNVSLPFSPGEVRSIASRIVAAGGDWSAEMSQRVALCRAVADLDRLLAAVGRELKGCDNLEHAVVCAVKSRMEAIADWHDTAGFNLTLSGRPIWPG